VKLLKCSFSNFKKQLHGSTNELCLVTHLTCILVLLTPVEQPNQKIALHRVSFHVVIVIWVVNGGST
jgi:hypothetical protein